MISTTVEVFLTNSLPAEAQISDAENLLSEEGRVVGYRFIVGEGPGEWIMEGGRDVVAAFSIADVTVSIPSANTSAVIFSEA